MYDSAKSKVSFLMNSHYELIEAILVNLPTEDLNSASLVCHSWNKTVKNIKKKRTKFDIQVIKSREIFGNIFERCIDKTTLPNVSITLMLYSFYNLYCHYILTRIGINKSGHSLVLNQLRKCAPKDCTNLIFTCSDLYGVDSSGVVDLSRGYETVTLSMPHAAHVEAFCLHHDMDFTANTAHAKCVLLFAYSADTKVVMQNIVAKLCDSELVLAAYLLPKFELKDGLHDHDFIKGLIFRGNVKVHKISIPIYAITFEEIENFILSFKIEPSFSWRQSVGFVFAEDQKRLITVHLSVFHKLFPRTSILGMDVLQITNGLEFQVPRRLSVRVPGISTMYHRPLTAAVQLVLIAWM